MTENYRKNVGIVVCNKGKVFMGARADSHQDHWQFPQGGIDKGEDIVAAAKRELFEETGIKSVSFLAMFPESMRYKFPKGTKTFGSITYVGQEQSWVLFKFEGDEDEINLKTTPEEIEFKKYMWTDIADAPQRIVEFKRDIYKKITAFFADLVEENQ